MFYRPAISQIHIDKLTYLWLSASHLLASVPAAVVAVRLMEANNNSGNREEKVTSMKLIKFLSVFVCALALIAGPAFAESCCVKAQNAGKKCEHPCCVEAHKDGKTCEKCQKDASCCDKAAAKGKDCAHPCCVDAKKEGKTCEKCNKKA